MSKQSNTITRDTTDIRVTLVQNVKKIKNVFARGQKKFGY
jgi:hypothetical protein